MRLLQQRPPWELTLTEIARAARVDPALLRYYFVDKHRLFAEVIARIGAEIEACGGAALASSGTPKERLARFVRASHDVHSRHPHYHQLILDQITHGDPERVRTMRTEMSRKLRAALLEVMREGERRGELRVTDPGYLGIAIIGMTEYFSATWGPVAALLGDAPENARRAYAAFIEDFVVRALEAR